MTLKIAKELWENNYKIKTVEWQFFIILIRLTNWQSPHGDYDHMGEAINLVKNFKVEKVIFNCEPYNDLEKED